MRLITNNTRRFGLIRSPKFVAQGCNDCQEGEPIFANTAACEDDGEEIVDESGGMFGGEPPLSAFGAHMLYGAVNAATAYRACEFIIKSNFLIDNQEGNYLTLILNTPGGSVTDGFAIIDAMQTSRIPVVTVGMGMIASMGVLLLAAGNKGNRIITKNSLIMAHQFAAGAYGKYHELVAAQQGNEIVKRIIMDHFKKHTTMSDKKIERIMFGPSDVYLTPEEVVKYGIADEVRETLMVNEEARDTEE